jgi:hypothetical protein
MDGAGFLAAAASAECPMSTTIFPVWLKDLIFSYVLQLPMLVSGVVRQGCAGRQQCTNRSSTQEDRIIIIIIIIIMAVRWSRTLR